MLKEAIEKIQEISEVAAGPKFLSCGGDHDHVYWLFNPGDRSLTRVEAAAQPRDHRVFSLAGVAAFAKENPQSRLWYCREGVTLVCDDTERRNVVVLDLIPSDQMRRLEAWDDKSQEMNQKLFLRTLRVDLAGTLGGHPDLVETIRTVRWKKSDTGEAVAKQGNASLGRKLEAKMSGAGAIPEVVTFSLPVWLGYPWRCTVACALDAEPETSTFTLRPLAGEIEKAYREGEAQLSSALYAELTEAGIANPAFFYGKP